MERFSIVVPAYNEEKRIAPMLEVYSSFFDTFAKEKKIDYELLVVVNNTTDKTVEIIKKLQPRYTHLRYLNLRPGGKGFAIIQGFKDALKRKNEYIGFVDADMATPPEAFYDLIKASIECDGVIAARWRKESTIINPWGLVGNLKSAIFNLIVRALFLFPYSDTQCGAKVFRREALQNVIDSLGITKWAFDIDLIYQLRKKGNKIIEIPTIWENKEGSKVQLVKASVEMFLAVVRLRLINSPFAFIIRAYDRLPEQLKIHHKIWK